MLDQVEYYTSDEEGETSNMDPPSSVVAVETSRQYDDDEEENGSLVCGQCGAVGDVLEEGGDQSEFRLTFLGKILAKYCWFKFTRYRLYLIP